VYGLVDEGYPENEQTMKQHTLTGRVALITGASRRRGIGFAVARSLSSLGADLFLHSFAAYDAAQPCTRMWICKVQTRRNR
jgi:hypothetical protein